jgi:hypothetical protein
VGGGDILYNPKYANVKVLSSSFSHFFSCRFYPKIIRKPPKSELYYVVPYMKINKKKLNKNISLFFETTKKGCSNKINN